MFQRRSFLVRSVVALSGCWLTISAMGCSRVEDITQYTVPKPESIQLPAGEGRTVSSGRSAKSSRPERMLGAIVPHGGQSWFFKLSGPVESVAKQVAEFRTFVESMSFQADGTPKWVTPAGWTQEPGSGMRYATLKIAAEEPLELTVIALPAGSEDYQQQILANVNRWRGQLSLAALSDEQLPKEIETVTTASGETATLVNFEGMSQGSSMGGPFANAPFAGGARRMPELPPASKTELKYAIPDGWREGKVSGIRKAAFEVLRGDQRVEVTVIDLPRDAGDRLANVNRWRGQIGLKELTADELKASMTSLEIAGESADVVELVGKNAKPQTILGAIVDHGDKTWFIKLQGDSALAAEEKARFESFAKSLAF